MCFNVESIKLSELLLLSPRNGLYKSKEYQGSGNRWVKMRDVYGNNFISSQEMELIEVTEDELEKFGCIKGDLLFGRTSLTLEGIGDCAIVDDVEDNPIFESNLFRLRLDTEKAEPCFYYYFFKSPLGKQYIQSIAKQTAATSITANDLVNLSVPYMELAEQKRVSNILYTLDKKIELNRQINQTLEQIAQAIFKSWFVDFEPVKAKIEAQQNGQDPERAAMRAISGKTDEELDQLNPKQHQQLTATAALFPDELVDSELGVIPKGWIVNQIQDIAKTIKGKSYKSMELEESNTALVTLKSFNRGGGYRLDGLKEYTGKYKPEQEVFAGDLIIAYTDVTQAADVIGKPAMVISDSRYEHLVISLDVAVVRPEIDSHKYFLYGMAKTVIFQQHTHSYTTGTTVLHLGKTAVPEYKFAIPSEDILDAYKNIVAPMFELINERIEESKNMERLRDAILPKLLSGEITLGDTQSTAEAVA